ncbi:hypothetical protein, partial [Escherichia coli]
MSLVCSVIFAFNANILDKDYA